jgi:vancomycin resistance protein VanW
VFWLKSRAHIGRRSWNNLSAPAKLHTATEEQLRVMTSIAAETITALYSDGAPNERVLQLGKVQNLRQVAARLDRLYLPAGAEFSLWRQVGRPSRRAGFVEGRELRAGCIIPTVAGGICQASNSLFEVARQAGFPVTERHGHSQQVAGALFTPGNDATVFWNYVDLRFKASRACCLRVHLTQDHLIVRLLCAA